MNRDRTSVNKILRKDEVYYRIRFEKAMIITLLILIAMFCIFQKIPEKQPEDWQIKDYIVVMLNENPVTKRKYSIKNPSLPKLPLIVEKELIPREESFDTLSPSLGESIPFFGNIDTGKEITNGFGDLRGVGEGFGEEKWKSGFVELAILIDSEGRVDSVRILENTTDSKRLEREAMLSAYRSWFIMGNKQKNDEYLWIKRKYRFKKK